MREILFRGFHPCEEGTEKVFIDGTWIKGKWVFGDFVKPCNIVYIAKGYNEALGKENTEICYDDEVIAETVGQFIGLTDKNGIKAFDGDIMQAHLDDLFPDDVTYAKIVWKDFSWCLEEFGYDDNYIPDPIEPACSEYWTIAGNVFSNLELLGDANNG